MASDDESQYERYKFIRKVEHKADGVLYVVTNEYMMANNIFKVGRTKKLSARLQTMNTSHTVSDAMFKVYALEFLDAKLAEHMVHYRLKKYRMSNRREFFNIDKDTIIKVIVSVRDWFMAPQTSSEQPVD